jgi:NADP-dependent 3-hydroxy acid dehydrogenase YdfG
MRTIIISGASSGIGRACAEKFASKNSQLVLCSRNIKELQKLKKAVEEKAAAVFIYELDVRKKDKVDEMFDDLEKQNINADILINNAGLALGLASIEDGDPSDWDQMIDTNVKGLLYMTHRVIRHMEKSNEGHIVNIGSIAGVSSYAMGAVYAATKSAVKFISDGLRKEVVNKKIKVTTIQPGLVETNFSNVRFHGDHEKANNVYKGIKPLTAGDIADLTSYIISTPAHVQICEVTVTPVHQASVDVVFRQ